MMHRCSSSHNMVGPCSCGLFHTQSNSSLSMFFSSMPTSHKPTAAAFDENSDPFPYPYPYPYPYPAPAASSVDCTLSLGTPSTRLSEDTAAADGDGKRSRGGAGQERRSSISNFCWDILGQNTSRHAPPSQSHKSAARGGGSSTSSGSSSSCSGDPLLARRCANCDTTSTPLWRNGPRGPKSLCNACGIRFKKEERRATAAAATAGNGASGGGGVVEGQHLFGHHHYSSWASQAPQQKLPCFGGEFRFIDDDSRDSDNGISFLSWRLNVTDRPSGLVHDFTR